MCSVVPKTIHQTARPSISQRQTSASTCILGLSRRLYQPQRQRPASPPNSSQGATKAARTTQPRSPHSDDPSLLPTCRWHPTISARSSHGLAGPRQRSSSNHRHTTQVASTAISARRQTCCNGSRRGVSDTPTPALDFPLCTCRVPHVKRQYIALPWRSCWFRCYCTFYISSACASACLLLYMVMSCNKGKTQLACRASTQSASTSSLAW